MSTDGIADPLIGVVLDEKYRIDAPLGRGGMGTVYRAMHLGTGREVALKVLIPELTANEASVERFKREARTAGQMRHPNVVDVTDFGFAAVGGGRLAYLVMELLQGKTLRALMESCGRVPLDVTIDVLDQVCAAVNEAHAMGVLHRDLKPENIHLGPGAHGRYRVKVLDFGIAKLLRAMVQAPPPAAATAMPAMLSPSAVTMPEMTFGTGPTMPISQGDDSLTRLGAVIGTPRYMSPEQWLGREIDVRADVYSLGVMAYEMLAGEPPFLGKDRSIAIEHAQLAAPPLAERAPTVPRWIARVVEQALAKEPTGRPPSAAAFAAGLKVGAETTGTLLRRSIELCADHYTSFLRISLIMLALPLVMSVVNVVVALLARSGMVSARVDHTALGGTIVLNVVVQFLLWAPVAGSTVLAVADVLAGQVSKRPAPTVTSVLKWVGPSLPPLLALTGILVVVAPILVLPIMGLATLAPHLGPHAKAMVATFVLTPLLCSITAVVLAPIAVFPATVVLEGARGIAPLRRSVALLRPMLGAAFGVTFFYQLLALMLPTLIQLLCTWDSAESALPGSSLAERAIALGTALLSAALMPFILVPPAMLYLRAREAEGKPFT